MHPFLILALALIALYLIKRLLAWLVRKTTALGADMDTCPHQGRE